MTVYAKKINQTQRRCMRQYEAISGFEFLHQDDIDSGGMSFNEAWSANIQFLENVLADVTNINTNGAWKF